MKKSSKKLIVALLCAAAAVLIGLVVYDGIKQSREFSSSSAMMNTAVSADIEGKDAKKVGKAVFDCISELENKLLSRHIETSAVSEINDAAGQSVKITLFSSSANGKINNPEKKMGGYTLEVRRAEKVERRCVRPSARQTQRPLGIRHGQ